MKKLFFLLIICSAFAKAETIPLLVNSKWLKDHGNDPGLVIVQVSFLKFDYDNEHIPGAQYLWPEWLAPNSPEGSFNLPDLKKATEIIQMLGVSNDSHVVLYYANSDVSVTARMFLTLEHLGMEGKVSLLDGGLNAWKKEGYNTSKEISKIKKGNFSAKQGSLIVNKDYVLKTLKSEQGVVVDARMQRFYDGEPTGNPRDGHITGARNIPYPDLLDQSNFFKPVSQLESYFTPVASKDKELVTYCFIGQTASVVYLAGRILGYHMKLYDGSLQEWSRMPELPMEKTQK